MLPLATLKLIVELNIKGEPQSRMRILLFCEPQITSILATPELQAVHNTLIHTLDIPPLSQPQVVDYIKFRLKNSSQSEAHPFHSEMIQNIYTQSEGVPGKINALVQQILGKSNTQQTQRHFFDISAYNKWIAIILGGVVLAGGILFAYWKYSHSEKSDENQVVEENSGISESPIESIEETMLTQPVIESEESNELGLSEEELAIEPEQGAMPSNESDFSEKSTNTPVVELAVPIPVESSESTTSVDSRATVETIKTEAWLRSQNATSFTLQILGTHNQLTVKRFINKYSLTNDVAMFKTTHRGRDWYVLVYGIYESRAQATSALEKLPSALQQNTRPWVRSISSIQNLIKE